MNFVLVVPLLLIAILVLFPVVQFNRMTQMRWRIKESWANVDTELRRRHDLIPNLVETVKGYAAHERALFAEATALRGQLGAMPNDSVDRRAAENRLAMDVSRLFAVAEAYPQLRASEGFLQLQYELVNTEDRIQAARRFFNGNVRDYNNQVQMFPGSMIARTFHFEAATFFELASVAERAAPTVAMPR